MEHNRFIYIKIVVSNNITYSHNSFPIYFRVVGKKLLLCHFINSFDTFPYCKKQHTCTFKTFHTCRKKQIIL